jgi:4-amino-4-deoxy-L-arabinose transferase-like glycosyltransferase
MRYLLLAAGRAGSSTSRLLMLLLLSLAARLPFVATNALSYDESHILTFATLVEQGHLPYREVFIGIPPLAVLSVQWGIDLFGEAPWVRLPLVLYAVVAVGLLFVLVRRHAPIYPVAAATLAAFLFSFNPHYFAISNTLNLEAAALCCGLLAVWALDNYGIYPGSRWRVLWIAASGAAFALSLALKILLPFLPGVILLQMLFAAKEEQPNASWRAWLGNVLWYGLSWLAGFLLTVGLFSLLYDPILVYRQVIDFRMDLREATVAAGSSGNDEVNVAEELVWLDLLQFVPLAVMTLSVLPALWRRRSALPARQHWRFAWLGVWVIWLLLSVLFLMTHIPLRPRHLVIPLPALAALSGMMLAFWWQQWRHRMARAVLAVVAGLALAVNLGIAGKEARIPDFTVRQPARAAVMQFIDTTTAPTDCLVSKENRFYFLTNRFPSPYLSEVSTSRLFSGKLTGAEVGRELDVQDCVLLVYAESYDDLAPGLRAEAEALYSLELALGTSEADEPITVFAVPLHMQTPPATPLVADLGDEIQFAGFELTPGPWTPGQTVYLSTFWQALRRPSTDYRMFVHLVDTENKLVFAADHFPFELDPSHGIRDIQLNLRYLAETGGALPGNYPNGGLIPTHLWQPGSILKETIALPLAQDLSPGSYRLVVGFFDPGTGMRLDVDDAIPGGIDNQIVLGDVVVQ